MEFCIMWLIALKKVLKKNHFDTLTYTEKCLHHLNQTFLFWHRKIIHSLIYCQIQTVVFSFNSVFQFFNFRELFYNKRKIITLHYKKLCHKKTQFQHFCVCMEYYHRLKREHFLFNVRLFHVYRLKFYYSIKTHNYIIFKYTASWSLVWD